MADIALSVLTNERYLVGMPGTFTKYKFLNTFSEKDCIKKTKLF